MENISMNISEVEQSSSSKFLPWIVCFSAALFFFYEFIQMNMFNAISSQLMSAFNLNAAQLGFLSAFYFYSNLIFLFPAGMILDRVSTRKVILISLAICVLGTFSFSLSTNYYIVALCRFLTGIGSSFCFLSCIRLASRWFPSNKMALISGLIVTMAMMGGMVAQSPLTALVEAFGWRHALFIDAAVGLVIWFIIFSLVRDYPRNFTQGITKQISEISFWKSIKGSYLNLQNWLCGLYTCLMNLPLSLLGALWGILFLKQVHHFSATQASLVTSCIFIGTIIGAPLAGFISDKISNRKIPMVAGSIISLFLVLMIINIPIHSLAIMMVLFFLLGLVTSTQVISYPAVAENNPPALTATSVSVVSFSVISGYAIFQPLFGRLMDLHWNHLEAHHHAIYTAANFKTALLILPIGFFIALCAAMLIHETQGKSAKSVVKH